MAYFPTAAFWFLDGYFLWQERLYRAVYDEVRLRPSDNIDFSMDTRPYRSVVQGWPKTTFSKTLMGFHGIVLFTVIVVMVVVIRS